MREGEANWILWGLALECGLCPTCRKPTIVHTTAIKSTVMHACYHCVRDWYQDHTNGRCVGWCAGWWAYPYREVQQPKSS